MTKEIEPVYQAVGIRIRMIRDALGTDQETLSKRLGCTRSHVASIETGRTRILLHDAPRIADALGTNIKGLMKGIWW